MSTHSRKAPYSSRAFLGPPPYPSSHETHLTISKPLPATWGLGRSKGARDFAHFHGRPELQEFWKKQEIYQKLQEGSKV